ncbi:MAG: hypothetical protein ACTSXE_02810, partial [Candidatus Thorarchaeota archaeon]
LVTGLIGSTPNSRGVMALAFSPTEVNELRFNRQLPHTYKQGSEIRFHVHWDVDDATLGDVRWGLEIMWTSINGTRGNTTVYGHTATAWGDKVHTVTTVIAIPGTGHTISSMLSCRLFRDPTHSEDTHPAVAHLFEADFHIQRDSDGSREEYSK